MESHAYRGPEIARTLGLSISCVQRRMKRRGLFLRPKWRYRTRGEWEAFLAQHETLKSAARALGTVTGKLHEYLDYAGVKPDDFTRYHNIDDVETDVLLGLLRNNERSAFRVSKMLGVHVDVVTRSLRNRGIAWETRRGPLNPLDDVSDAELLATYAEHGCRAGEILNVPTSTFYRTMKRRGLR